jgi:hypothetical protein
LKGHKNIGFEQLCIDVIASKTSSPGDMEEKKKLVLDSVARVAQDRYEPS